MGKDQASVRLDWHKRGQLTLTHRDANGHSATLQVPVETHGNPPVIAFNARYLADALEIGGTLCLSDELSPGICRHPGGRFCVIMPMRVAIPAAGDAGEMVRIAAYAGHWIRDPETWSPSAAGSPREIIRSLLEHLFARWQMPACFDSAWLIKGDLHYLERDWYCHLAGGGSLRNVQGMPPSISSKALHLAMNAPRDLTIREALRYGQVKAGGGSDEFLAEVLASWMVRNLSNDAVWSRLIVKVIAAGNPKPGTFGIIADTLLQVISKHGVKRAGTLVNLPLHELLSYCRTFWRTILKAIRASHPEWKWTDIDCPHVRSELLHHSTDHWPRLQGSKPFHSTCCRGERTMPCRIVELTYQWQLVAESKAMKHCVDSYVRKCRLEKSSIFSLRTDENEHGSPAETSHLTIEVNRQTRKIIQVRGRWNQSFAPERIPLLWKWAQELDLVI